MSDETERTRPPTHTTVVGSITAAAVTFGVHDERPRINIGDHVSLFFAGATYAERLEEMAAVGDAIGAAARDQLAGVSPEAA